MSHVDLGFSQACEPWQVKSYQFPSKIGGKPAWLDLENLPASEQLQCANCGRSLVFLCQVYAPFEEDDSSFHRTVFVFMCRSAGCCERNSSRSIAAFRSSLSRVNKFYSSQPPGDEEDIAFSLEKWANLCDLCGCLGEKTCGKCKRAKYCSRQHQVIDWKEGHKRECGKADNARLSSELFPEFEIVIEAEDFTERSVDIDEELEKFRRLQRDGKTGSMEDVPEEDMEKYAVCRADRAFQRFKRRISDNPDQILRYERGGQPLWIAADPKPEAVPDCEHCGAARQFEFQIMPQLLSVLHENDLDMGVICIYTCARSCVGGDNYKKEFVFKQDVAINE